MEDFFQMVTRTFGFLVDKYAFQLISGPSQSSSDSIRYEKKPLVIELGWYKGEIDIAFHVDLENEVFRPYISRTFSLSEVARRQDKTAYQHSPRFPHYITTATEAETWLQFEAAVMRKYCKPLLRGDLGLLEEITEERKGTRR